MRQRWMLAGVAMAAMALTGCPATESSSGIDPPGSAPSTSGGCAAQQGATDLESALRLVPDTDGNRELVQVADLEAFLADQGKELPGDLDDIRFVDPVALFTPTPLLQDALAQADETTDPLADEFGIGIGQVRLGISAGLPPDVAEVLVGDFDPAAAEKAVAADPFWSSRMTKAESSGETVYAWGDDNEIQAAGRSPIRTLGIGGRLWVDDHVAAYTRSTGVMDALLAGCVGDERTLADDSTYAGIARHLGGFDGAFDATITNQVRSPDEVGGDRRPRTTQESVANTFDGAVAYGFASGRSDDPERARIRLVVAFGSDEEAARNVQPALDRVQTGTSARTGQPWSDLLEVASTDVDGPFVIVELLATNASVLQSDLATQDSLIVSE